MRKMIVLLLVVAVFVIIMPVGAQDGLSDEEIALIDRVLDASDPDEAFDSYQFERGEERVLDMTLSFAGQDIAFNESYEVTTEGYYKYDGAIESGNATSELMVFTSNPDGEVSFSMTADVIGVDEALYVNATVVDGINPADDLGEGWLTITSADEIPVALEDFGFDDFFDDEEEDEDDPTEDRELLISLASTVTLEESELENGTPVELITMLIDGDNLLEFFAELSKEDDGDNPFTQAIYTSDVQGEIILIAALDADDNLVGKAILMNMVIESLNLSEVDIEGLPADVEIAMTMGNIQYTEYGELGGEFPAIEAPIE